MNTALNDTVTLDMSNTVEDNLMLHLDMKAISVRAGFNPRRYFDEAKLQELVDSIRVQGVIQPIVVTPDTENEGNYFLVAGERRYRAATIASIPSIPAIIRELTDEEAIAIAISENSNRDDVSPSEEARACHRMMATSKNSDDAAMKMGWGKKKFDSRLLLLHCSEAVLNALDERKIKVGHAELLSSLIHDMQDQSLIGIIDNNVSVASLRENIGRYAYKLADATFDTADCIGCPHSSNCTADLFDTSLEDGHCLNRDCYDQKTHDHLIAIKDELSEKYPVIYLDIEKPADTRCHLVREGSSGVGKAQFSACQGCANFGALMATNKGNEGQVEEGICFDTACNKTKITDHATALKAEADSHEQEQNIESSDTDPVATTTTPIAAKPKKAVSTETPKKVQEFINEKHYAATVVEVNANNDLVKVFALIALIEANKTYSKNSITNAVMGKHGVAKLRNTSSRHEQIAILSKLSPDAIGDLIRAFAAGMAGENRSDNSFSGGNPLKTAHAALAVAGADITKHFVVDTAFLETFTISGLHSLLDEAGFIAWYDNINGDGECAKKVLNGKRGDQITNVMKAGFQWAGFVPAIVALPQ